MRVILKKTSLATTNVMFNSYCLVRTIVKIQYTGFDYSVFYKHLLTQDL